MSTEDLLSQLKDAYITTFPNQTSKMEALILEMEKGNDYQSTFEALYRQVHNIKGSAGAFGFTIISSICHQMEDYLTNNIHHTDTSNSAHINHLLAYVDLLTDTSEGILQESIDITTIEAKLEVISQKSLANSKKCLCVGVSDSLYHKIVQQVSQSLGLQCSFVTSGMTAMERLLHEHFDVLVCSRENTDLNGFTLIAALRLNKRKNSQIPSILITSNPDLAIPEDLQPDFIVKKDKDFATELSQSIEGIVNR